MLLQVDIYETNPDELRFGRSWNTAQMETRRRPFQLATDMVFLGAIFGFAMMNLCNSNRWMLSSS